MAHLKFAASKMERTSLCTASATIDVSGVPEGDTSAADRGTVLHQLSHDVLIGNHTLESVHDLHQYSAVIDRQDGSEDIHVLDLCDEDRRQVDFCVSAVLDLMVDGDELHLEIFGVTDEPECGGTSDIVILSPSRRLLIVCDKKYGGLTVRTRKNHQLATYGIAMLRRFSILHEIDEVEMRILQPAHNRNEAWRVSTAELEEFAADNLYRPIREIREGRAKFDPSDEACQFCPVKRLPDGCPAQNEAARKAAEEFFSRVEFDEEVGLGMPDFLVVNPKYWTWSDKKRVAEIVEAWAKGVHARVEEMLRADPASVPGYKMVVGLGNRAFKDFDSAVAYMSQHGFSREDCQIQVDPKPMSPSQMEKLFKGRGSGALREGLAEFVVQPETALTVVPESDPRKAWCEKKAEDVFGDESSAMD